MPPARPLGRNALGRATRGRFSTSLASSAPMDRHRPSQLIRPVTDGRSVA